MCGQKPDSFGIDSRIAIYSITSSDGRSKLADELQKPEKRTENCRSDGSEGFEPRSFRFAPLPDSNPPRAYLPLANVLAAVNGVGGI